MNTKTVLSAALLSLSAVAVTAQAAPEAPKNWEQCAGVAKAGKNDCAALNGAHVCAGMSKGDNLASEWVFVPEGTCEKIGGMVKKVVPAS